MSAKLTKTACPNCGSKQWSVCDDAGCSRCDADRLRRTLRDLLGLATASPAQPARLSCGGSAWP